MTKAQIQKIKDELNAAWQAGKIHADEYFDTLDLLDSAPEMFFFEAARVLGQTNKEEPRKGPDPGERAADRAVSDIEKKVRKVYGAASTEMKGNLKQLEKYYENELENKRNELRTGKIDQDEFNSWVRGQLLQQKIMKERIDQCTGTLLHANEKALGIVNGERLSVFAENANFQSYQLDKQIGLNLMFSVYDETTAERLLRDNPDLLPPKKINGKKDKAWNQHRITAAVAQAVIQGDSIPKLAARIAGDSALDNMNAMIRYARTAMTGAQNAGRQEMLQQATAMGIKCKKCWLATLDHRTRDSHARLDGETVDVDKSFSNGLDFPGDPNGDPGEIWNCRCTMTYEYDGYESSAAEVLRRDNETGELIHDMTYQEWKRMNAPVPEKRTEEKKEPEKQPAPYFDEIMKKANALPRSETAYGDGDKKNLLPMADSTLSDQAHRIFMSMSEEEERKLTREITMKISDLKTEQSEVFVDRIEELAEAFNGRNVTGARTDEYDGITVAKWQGEYIVLDGNNRTNLAILKGQKDLDVMLIDFDDNSELRDRVEEIVKRSPVQGKDITGTWHPRPGDFRFEIEDVINAQGFDGLPRIVDEYEFNAAVRESKFVAQRSYSATGQDTLDSYRDMLYNGKWYVDCSEGGAQYGQGMYCAADYTGKITDGMKEEMQHYRDLNEGRQGNPQRDYAQEVYLQEVKKVSIPIEEKYRDALMDEFGITDHWTKGKPEREYVKDWIEKNPEESKRLKKDLEEGQRRGVEKGTEIDRMSKEEFRQKFPNKAPCSYTETFTLTPDAKIITYADAYKLNNEYKNEYRPRLMQKEIEKLSEDEQVIWARETRTQMPGIDPVETIRKAKAIEEKLGEEKYQAIAKKAFEMQDKIQEQYDRECKDLNIGAVVAMHGYDAINASEHGQSGSYTVILNRTKCIFRRDTK